MEDHSKETVPSRQDKNGARANSDNMHKTWTSASQTKTQNKEKQQWAKKSPNPDKEGLKLLDSLIYDHTQSSNLGVQVSLYLLIFFYQQQQQEEEKMLGKENQFSSMEWHFINYIPG